MVVVPSRESSAAIRDMKKEIEAYGRPDQWQVRYPGLAAGRLSVSFARVSRRWWRCTPSDVGLITPLRDGMNLVAKEYLACQDHSPGVLILSEMAGLRGAERSNCDQSDGQRRSGGRHRQGIGNVGAPGAPGCARTHAKPAEDL